MTERPFLYIARKHPAKQIREDGTRAYLPDPPRTNTIFEGVAETGEVSTKGTVAHTEDWEGRIMATALPATIRYIRDPDGRIRPMTMPELVDHGFFIVGTGPT